MISNSTETKYISNDRHIFLNIYYILADYVALDVDKYSRVFITLISKGMNINLTYTYLSSYNLQVGTYLPLLCNIKSCIIESISDGRETNCTRFLIY